MGYYLLDNRNKHGSHFYSRRNKEIDLFVVHITARLEDLDGTDDHSAEKTARYAAMTATHISWHSGSDADSLLQLLPDRLLREHGDFVQPIRRW